MRNFRSRLSEADPEEEEEGGEEAGDGPGRVGGRHAHAEREQAQQRPAHHAKHCKSGLERIIIQINFSLNVFRYSIIEFLIQVAIPRNL